MLPLDLNLSQLSLDIKSFTGRLRSAIAGTGLCHLKPKVTSSHTHRLSHSLTVPTTGKPCQIYKKVSQYESAIECPNQILNQLLLFTNTNVMSSLTSDVQ